MSQTTDQIIAGLFAVAPDLIGQLIERLHGADPQTREAMIAEMHGRRDAMRAKVDAEIDRRFPIADTEPAPSEE